MKEKQLTEEKVFAYMQQHHMLKPGDRVVAGISGGADSVCLLFVLLEWSKRVPMQLAVVHVNHGIRKEASQDAAYVEGLCREYKLPFYLVEENVRQKAIADKCSEEEMGRRVRYEAFARVAQEFGADKIAVAHNSNDRSETMLFHLFRGSGIKGLSSIQPLRENIIRPILCLERSEIESYLKKKGISYCEDATNQTDDYTRNRIRHHILPYVEKEIVQGCVRHMTQTAEMLSEAEDYLEQQTAAALEQCVHKQEADCEVSVSVLLQLHPAIQKRVLHTLVKSISPEQKDISYVHIQDLLGLFTGEGNRQVSLPFGICGRREYDKVILYRKKSVKKNSEKSHTEESRTSMIKESVLQQELRIMLPEEDDFPDSGNWQTEVTLEDGRKICFSMIKPTKLFGEIPQNKYTKWFDYDKIERYVEIRYRQTGDYLTITDGNGNMLHKSLKDYMISQKIPRTQRDSIPLITEGKHVLWLPGYRISEFYKVSENTKRILQVQLISNKITKGEMEENNDRTY